MGQSLPVCHNFLAGLWILFLKHELFATVSENFLSYLYIQTPYSKLSVSSSFPFVSNTRSSFWASFLCYTFLHYISNKFLAMFPFFSRVKSSFYVTIISFFQPFPLTFHFLLFSYTFIWSHYYYFSNFVFDAIVYWAHRKVTWKYLFNYPPTWIIINFKRTTKQ